uniref:Uncharacterized protein n=1 Tax=Anguilla anguilla TaxID=7936 RepID=A0A0E9UCJ3_ANGAN
MCPHLLQNDSSATGQMSTKRIWN